MAAPPKYLESAAITVHVSPALDAPTGKTISFAGASAVRMKAINMGLMEDMIIANGTEEVQSPVEAILATSPRTHDETSPAASSDSESSSGQLEEASLHTDGIKKVDFSNATGVELVGVNFGKMRNLNYTSTSICSISPS